MPPPSSQAIDSEQVPVIVSHEKDVAIIALSPVEHARLLRKLDWHIIPLITVLYLFCFLDRLNIGNARVAGMAGDLHLVGFRYNTAASVFYILYILAEIPSNIILKIYRPSRWIPTSMVAWGLVTTFMCLVDSYRGLLITRIFLGLTEAGLFPGATYYISSWYPRADRAKRVAMFFSAATAAGACAGILAFTIENMNGVGGLHGWQWIFCLEGLATIVVALAAYFLMHDYPETASFLTEPERRYLIWLLAVDSQSLASHYDFKFVLQALTDYKTYVQAGIYIGAITPVYGCAFFSPTIIHELGFSPAAAQLLSVPPFVAGCISTVLVGIYSDFLKLRGPFVIAGGFVSLMGYIVLYTQTSPGAAYFGAILATVGVFPIIVIVNVWACSNAGGEMKRGVVIATVNGLGNLGGICASFIYFDPPRFHIGHGTMMGHLILSMFLSAFAMWDYNRINKQKIEACRQYRITEKQKDQFKNMGDESPLFRYTL